MPDIPYITCMDDSLNLLENCEKLSLSTNAIKKMIPLPNLKNLKVLSLGRNQITRIAGLEEVSQTLEELWISYNQIEKLDGLSQCHQMKTLLMANNNIKKWEEIEKLAQLPELKTVSFIGNPIYGDEDWEVNAAKIVKRIPQLEMIDNQVVTYEIRQLAQEMN